MRLIEATKINRSGRCEVHLKPMKFIFSFLALRAHELSWIVFYVLGLDRSVFQRQANSKMAKASKCMLAARSFMNRSGMS